MLLTITTTHRPATDLGFLLHKHPDRQHEAELAFGTARVLYPVAGPDECTAAVLVDVDPVGLSRSRPGGRPLAPYVNDRPYAASSLLAVALTRLFGTALSGRSKERPELAGQAIDLRIGLPALPCRGGAGLLRQLFEPLGYQVRSEPVPLDSHFPGWGPSPYLSVTLAARARLADVLAHLVVLIPVLDDDKHYWAGQDEVDKLVRRGGSWLAAHPEQDLIARRYLRHDRILTREALARLCADDAADPDRADAEADAAEESAERAAGAGPAGPAPGPGLSEQRLAAVLAEITAAGARTVLDLGCGSGRLLAELLRLPGLTQVTGLDVSHQALARAARRLRLERMTPRERARIELLHGSLTYTDQRLRGFDAAALVEVIEHLDPPRLAAFERCLLDVARPGLVVITTPNAEYNPLFGGLAPGALRHPDHRFEWTREQFAAWAQAAAARHGYAARMSGIGPADPAAGCPTQLAVLTR